jgi:hypothetical protein
MTGLLLTGVVSATLAFERRAADRRSADRRAAGSGTTPGNARMGGPAGARAPGLSAEGRDERRPEQAAIGPHGTDAASGDPTAPLWLAAGVGTRR